MILVESSAHKIELLPPSPQLSQKLFVNVGAPARAQTDAARGEFFPPVHAEVQQLVRI